uniref:Uncharacterized protein n=1 Tax=viral metagenome TaxID=1070528 RepID=A0A6C0CNT2_9ZZZZ
MEQRVETNNTTSDDSGSASAPDNASNNASASSEKKIESVRKVLQDLVRDLLHTFPELNEALDPRLRVIYDGEESLRADKAVESLVEYFNTVYPERFFDILYQNEEMFENDSLNLNFLPSVDFRVLWKENISESTKETLWKYLQLILFSTVSNVDSGDSFGDTAKLFEAINQDEFKSKLEETMKGMQDMFEKAQGEGEERRSNINLDEMPNAEDIHNHVEKMMGGKLGALAKEIAEETARDLNIDMTDASSVSDVFKNLMKNPTKLMGMVKNVGSKLDEKIKSGDIKESELLQEASEMMKNMRDMPGFGNIQEMLSKMGGMKGGKVNTGAMQAHMERNIKLAQQKERIRAKVQANKNVVVEKQMSAEEMAAAEAAAEKARIELLQMIDNDENNLVFRSGEGAVRSSKRKKGKKKKKKKKSKDKSA